MGRYRILKSLPLLVLLVGGVYTSRGQTYIEQSESEGSNELLIPYTGNGEPPAQPRSIPERNPEQSSASKLGSHRQASQRTEQRYPGSCRAASTIASATAQATSEPTGYQGSKQVWVPGHYVYRFQTNSYVWVPGEYRLPPHSNLRFVAGRWQHKQKTWYWVQSHWAVDYTAQRN